MNIYELTLILLENHLIEKDSVYEHQLSKSGGFLSMFRYSVRKGYGTLESLEELLELTDDAELPHLVREKLSYHFRNNRHPDYTFKNFGIKIHFSKFIKNKKLRLKNIDFFCKKNNVSPTFLLFSELEEFEYWVDTGEQPLNNDPKPNGIKERLKGGAIPARHDGQTLKQWAEQMGISYAALYSRMHTQNKTPKQLWEEQNGTC